MNKKILLISSSLEEICLMSASLKHPKGIRTSVNYPLGIAYLHSYLERLGYEIKSLNLNKETFEECFKTVLKAIDNFSPQLVGLQMLSGNRVSSYKLIEYIHQKYPHIHLVTGGIHASLMAEQLVKKYPYLTVVVGEGEITFAELINQLQNQALNLAQVDGIVFNQHGQIITTPARALIENLDTIPFPKHELFYWGQKKFCASIITSRGCPFRCSFCSLYATSKRKVRFRSVQNVIEEIEYLYHKFPDLAQIWLQDDSFFLDNQRVIDICDEIIKRQIKTKFICSGKVKPIKKQMIKKLETANFELVALGLENANDEILAAAHKGITQADTLKVFELFKNSKVNLFAFLIVGLPGETRKTVMKTINFVKKLQKIKYMPYHNVANLVIYPGTEIYAMAKTAGLINDDFWLSDQPVPLFTVEHSQTEIFDFKETMLNHLALSRFWTKPGFKAQFTMLPTIIKYLFVSGRIVVIFTRWLKKLLPQGIYKIVKKIYHSLLIIYRSLSPKTI